MIVRSNGCCLNQFVLPMELHLELHGPCAAQNLYQQCYGRKAPQHQFFELGQSQDILSIPASRGGWLGWKGTFDTHGRV